MRKFLLIINIFAIVLIAGCSKTDTNKSVQKENKETKIETSSSIANELLQVEEMPQKPIIIPTEKGFPHIIMPDELPEGLNNQERAFAIAILTGDESKVAELLKQGINPNQNVRSCKYINGPAICNASANGSNEIVNLLLDAKANPNVSCSSDGTTSLMNASERSLAILRSLIAAGANVNATDKEGRTALFKANSPEIAKALLDAGADINAVDKNGHNASFYDYHKNPEVIKFLLDAGIRTNHEDKNESLRKACNTVAINVVKTLIESGVDVNSKDRYGKTALMNATIAPLDHFSVEDAKTIIKMLIDAGADINATDNDGNTALINLMSEWSDSDGVNYDKVEMIDILVSMGANVNATNKKGETALMSIYLEDYTDYDSIVKKLLSRGADINATDNEGKTVLMDFVSKINEKEASSTDEEDNDYPDQYPSIEKIKSFLNTLLSTKIDINTKDKNGKTALTLAKEAGNDEIVKLLKDAGAKE